MRIILQQSKATNEHLLDNIICFEHIQILGCYEIHLEQLQNEKRIISFPIFQFTTTIMY